jgi:hypothetical protein
MRSRLALSALVVAALFGATAVASAQTQPAPGASTQGNVGPGATSDSTGKMMKPGATTGMNQRDKKSDSRNPSTQGNVGPGTNQAGSIGK